METGRRISEVCTLPFHCLEFDHQGDAFLKVHDQKLKKMYLLPISNACLQAIQQQQRYVQETHALTSAYFFLPGELINHKTSYSTLCDQALNKLAEDMSIRDETGQIWHFHTHQFRHTVGTQ